MTRGIYKVNAPGFVLTLALRAAVRPISGPVLIIRGR